MYLLRGEMGSHAIRTSLTTGVELALRLVLSDFSGFNRTAVCRLRQFTGYDYAFATGTWSFACWDTRELDAFKQAIFDTVGFSRMREKKPAEVNTSFDTVTSVLHLPKPEPGAGQMWWGVM
jgi:hypothetical protein